MYPHLIGNKNYYKSQRLECQPYFFTVKAVYSEPLFLYNVAKDAYYVVYHVNVFYAKKGGMS
ncbi:hypothetical protein AN965_05040 [Alkalicoccobacillus plakortidis]|uniref:Uncharacterized protein n=1 Tax=Alkalicoccobacillus plakortidis TaxID=444060 RepID=A0A9D5DU88_9BACI|nr:hypothetical protein AN965_05040 [Alkalicoccobacillus plakortidis]MBG9784218.1 hypothetical protein [Shouchella lehensis]